MSVADTHRALLLQHPILRGVRPYPPKGYYGPPLDGALVGQLAFVQALSIAGTCDGANSTCFAGTSVASYGARDRTSDSNAVYASVVSLGSGSRKSV